MENTIYDTHFNGNEWFVIALTVFGFAAIWLFPRPFSPAQTTFNMLIGISLGLLFDHTIAIPPFDYYDVGDQSKYQLFDLLSYIMYAPIGYWFIFWYERMRMYELSTIVYILLWSVSALGLEWLAVKVGVFHYKNGYRLGYSFPIYVILQSLHLALFSTAFSRDRRIGRNRPSDSK